MPSDPPLKLHERITAALVEIIDCGEEARARGYAIPPAAADGVIKLNIMAVVIRGQEDGRQPTQAQVAAMMTGSLPVDIPAAFRA